MEGILVWPPTPGREMDTGSGSGSGSGRKSTTVAAFVSSLSTLAVLCRCASVALPCPIIYCVEAERWGLLDRSCRRQGFLVPSRPENAFDFLTFSFSLASRISESWSWRHEVAEGYTSGSTDYSSKGVQQPARGNIHTAQHVPILGSGPPAESLPTDDRPGSSPALRAP